MDLLGIFPSIPMGNRYIIVAVDYLTEWSETGALPNGAVEAAQFIVKKRRTTTRCTTIPYYRPRKMLHGRINAEFWRHWK